MRAVRRRAVIAAVAGPLAGCFVDIHQNDGTGAGTTTTTTSGTMAGTSTGAASTAPTTSTGSATTEAGASTTGTSADTGSTGPTTTTTDPATTEPPPLCPAIDAFVAPVTADPVCDECLRTKCCGEFEACGAGCVDVWNCALNDECLANWGACPDYDAYKPAFDATMVCKNTTCHVECNIGACSGQTSACDADPECLAIGTCSDACIADCPDCVLACWGMCKDQHPEGVAEWDAFWTCLDDQCP